MIKYRKTQTDRKLELDYVSFAKKAKEATNSEHSAFIDRCIDRVQPMLANEFKTLLTQEFGPDSDHPVTVELVSAYEKIFRARKSQRNARKIKPPPETGQAPHGKRAKTTPHGEGEMSLE